MLNHLGLRLRIFLFFVLLMAGGGGLAAAALYIGWSRAETAAGHEPFVAAFLIFAFLNSGLIIGIWFLFDENVAKPINKLASDLRLSAHAGVDRAVDMEAARYLGDLAPAASAISSTLSSNVLGTAEFVARETERLQAEANRLTAVLTEIPVATLLVNEADEIVLYDGQAAEVLARTAPPRLKAPLYEYFDRETLSNAKAELAAGRDEASFQLADAIGRQAYDARIRRLEPDGYILVLDVERSPERHIAARPLVYDFDLMDARDPGELRTKALSELCFVVFDTETTGLSTEQDAVVQIGAVRVLNGRMLEGEVLDTFVDPGRPIPLAATKIHNVSDADVAGAPDFVCAGRDFHAFARDAVLVAHNAPFDLAFFRRFEQEMGVNWGHPVIDTVLLSAIVFGITEDHSLDALCERLAVDIAPGSRHSALGDAVATAEALIKLIPLLDAKGLPNLGEVILEAKKYNRLLQDLN